MKNIHLLPTDKPSRLSILNNGKLNFGAEIMSSSNSKPQHIYITSDEETKENTWCFAILSGQVFKNINRNLKSSDKKKIILTTDQDLIKDGVQAIDDEFLEWFVKNPTCEYIKWNAYPISPNGNLVATDKPYPFVGLISNFRIEYKIIIPQEEPKQELDCPYDFTSRCTMGRCDCKPKQETLEETAERLFPKEKHPTSFETLRRAFISNAVRRQETLEEAAEIAYQFETDPNFPDETEHKNFVRIFKKGAKWQSERMYSEEDMKESFINGALTDLFNTWGISDKDMAKEKFDVWFEQFKKK